MAKSIKEIQEFKKNSFTWNIKVEGVESRNRQKCIAIEYRNRRPNRPFEYQNRLRDIPIGRHPDEFRFAKRLQSVINVIDTRSVSFINVIAFFFFFAEFIRMYRTQASTFSLTLFITPKNPAVIPRFNGSGKGNGTARTFQYFSARSRRKQRIELTNILHARCEKRCADIADTHRADRGCGEKRAIGRARSNASKQVS